MSEATGQSATATPDSTAPAPAAPAPAAPAPAAPAPAEPAPAAPAPAAATPVEYQPFTVQPGHAALDEAAATAVKGLGLSQAQAQAVADLMTGRNHAANQAFRDLTDTKWVADSLADKDLSADGKALNADVQDNIRRAVELGGKEFAGFLAESRAGNHPAVLKFLATVGKLGVAGPKYVDGKAAPSGSAASLADQLYGPKK